MWPKFRTLSPTRSEAQLGPALWNLVSGGEVSGGEDLVPIHGSIRVPSSAAFVACLSGLHTTSPGYLLGMSRVTTRVSISLLHLGARQVYDNLMKTFGVNELR